MICPYIILLSGTPGTGKTMLSNILKKSLGWEVFPFGNYIMDNHLYIKEDRLRDTKIIDMETCSIKGFLEVLNLWIRKKSSLTESEIKNKSYIPIVVDSHYADIIMDGIIEFKSNSKKYLLDINAVQSINELNPCLSKILKHENIVGIVLRCEPLELEKRLNERKYSPSKVFENIEAEILGDCTKNMMEVLKENKVFEINTAEFNLEQTKNFIESILNTPEKMQKFKAGNINWLKLVGKDARYDKFFKGDFGIKKDIKIDDEGDIIFDPKDDDENGF
jgi:adenylate kinase